MAYKFESCAELAQQYEAQAQQIEKRIQELKELAKVSTCPYRVNRKIAMYNDMLLSCRITRVELEEYK